MPTLYNGVKRSESSITNCSHYFEASKHYYGYLCLEILWHLILTKYCRQFDNFALWSCEILWKISEKFGILAWYFVKVQWSNVNLGQWLVLQYFSYTSLLKSNFNLIFKWHVSHEWHQCVSWRLRHRLQILDIAIKHFFKTFFYYHRWTKSQNTLLLFQV